MNTACTMLALRPVLVHCKFPVCLYNVCNAVTNAIHTRQAYSPFITPDLLLFAELSLILRPDYCNVPKVTILFIALYLCRVLFPFVM